MFGISAGSISISTLFLNAHLEKYVRATVSIFASGSHPATLTLLKILESGIAGTTFTFNATRRQSDWDNFVAALPECKDVAHNNTFDCLRRDDINTTHLIQAINASLDATRELFPWVPTLDGPDGLLPDLPSKMLKQGRYSKIPFITGNCLDEGVAFMLS